MIHRCAWCGLEYGPPSDEPDQDFVTHGICPECEERFHANRPESLRRFLNRFDTPILCVDDNVQVITANDAACGVLAKDRDEVGDAMCGELVECRWSRLPEGCGKTEHCLACSIRLLVGQTLSADGNVQNLRASVDREDESGHFHRVEFLISSERHADLVLLKFEEIDTE